MITLCQPADAGTHPFPLPLCTAGVPSEWARQSRPACRWVHWKQLRVHLIKVWLQGTRASRPLHPFASAAAGRAPQSSLHPCPAEASDRCSAGHAHVVAAAVPWLATVFAEPAHQMQRLRTVKEPVRGGPKTAGSLDAAAGQLEALQALLLMLPLPQVRWPPLQPVTTPEPDALLACDRPAAVPAPDRVTVAGPCPHSHATF